MIVSKKQGIVLLGIGWLFFVGCKVYQPAPLPVVATPSVYNDTVREDTSTMAQLAPKELFTDPYLSRLIDSVLYHNLDLKRAVQRIQIAQAQYYIRKAALLPRVEGQASAGFDKYGNYTQNGVGNYDTDFSDNINDKQHIPYPVTPDFFVGARANWEIDLWGKLKNLKRAAYARFLASQKGVHLVQTSLVAQTASLYYQLLALDNQLRVIHDNIRLQDSALSIVKIQKRAARVNELAVQQFTAQVYNTKALEGVTLQQITETENQINFLLGRFPQRIERDTSLLNKPLPPMVQIGVPSQLLQQRPDIQQAELELIATKADVAAARRAFYPSLNLTPYVGMNSFKLPLIVHGGSLTYGILGSLTAPIFYQGILKRSLHVADATRLEAYYAYEQSIQNGVREVVNSLSKLQNNRNVFALKEKEVQTLDSAVVTSNLLFKTGFASYLEVITAQRSVVSSQLELVNAKAQMFYAVIELYRALGGGWR